MTAPGPTIVTRPRRHPVRALLTGLAVLALVLVAADRIGLVAAERATAATIRNSQGLDSTPSVKVAGFPFLTQLASGHFSQITIKARDVPAGTGPRALTVAAVTVVLHSVHVDRELSSVRADSATASGTLSYPELSQAVGVAVSYDGSVAGVGRVRATGSVTVLGQKITATVSSGLTFSGGALGFTDPKVDGVDIPSAAVPILAGLFGAPLQLTNLPFGVTVTGVRATPAGITIGLAGADLVYTRS
jgi:hypothetical protein